jgi:hypothetical protein
MKVKKLILTVGLMFLGSTILAEPKVGTMAYESVVLNFTNGSYELNSDEETKLKTAIGDAKVKGKIVKVELAVWSDKDHPTTGNLPKTDEKLANERIEAVKKALKQDLGHVRRIEAYNMAENVSFVGRHFHSDEAKLDEVFSKSAPGAIAREDFSLIKKEGAPSKAVVILKIRE